MIDTLTARERAEWADEINGISVEIAPCVSCNMHLAGDRDSASPYCGTCDPDGMAFFYDVLNGKRVHARDAVCRANAKRMKNSEALSHALDWLAEQGWHQGRKEGEAIGAGEYNAAFGAGDHYRRAIVVGKIAINRFVAKPNLDTRTALLIAVGW